MMSLVVLVPNLATPVLVFILTELPGARAMIDCQCAFAPSVPNAMVGFRCMGVSLVANRQAHGNCVDIGTTPGGIQLWFCFWCVSRTGVPPPRISLGLVHCGVGSSPRRARRCLTITRVSDILFLDLIEYVVANARSELRHGNKLCAVGACGLRAPCAHVLVFEIKGFKDVYFLWPMVSLRS